MDIVVWKSYAMFPIPNVEMSEPSFHCTGRLIGHEHGNALSLVKSREGRKGRALKDSISLLYCGERTHLRGSPAGIIAERYTDPVGREVCQRRAGGDAIGCGLWAEARSHRRSPGFQASEPARLRPHQNGYLAPNSGWYPNLCMYHRSGVGVGIDNRR